MNVSYQAHGERNYHVFYELLAGLPVEQKEEMYLQEAESYFYLNQVSELRVLCSSWERNGPGIPSVWLERHQITLLPCKGLSGQSALLLLTLCSFSTP